MGRPLPTTTARALLAIDGALPSGAVSVDRDVCAAYARDESEAEATVPDAVVRAGTTAEVAAVLRAAHEHRVPVTPRAGGTSRVGAATCVAGGIVLSCEGMGSVREIDRDDGIAVVEPGVVLGDLHRAVEAEGLFYPPDPNSLDSCQLGGNLALNAGGPRAFKYGVTGDYVLGLEAVAADGTVLDVGRRTSKGVTGYDLTALLVGSEGTLAVITRATLKLIPRPEALRTLLVFLDREDRIAQAVGTALRHRVIPRCVELLDRHTLAVLREDGGPVPLPAEARAMLLLELDGEPEAADRDLERLGTALDEVALEVLVAKHGADRERLWSVRRGMSRALRRRARHKLSEDVVVPRSRLGALLATCQQLSAAHEIRMPSYGHAGDGNLHVNFLWDEPEERPRVDAAIRGLFEAVIDLGGTLSGEHGIGVLKAPFLPLEQSPAVIDLSRRIKAQFDPRGILNPGKVFAAEGATRHGVC
ncbi:MAG: FAD-binding oxidoreductase [Sandaracinaceae bacterium]